MLDGPFNGLHYAGIGPKSSAVEHPDGHDHCTPAYAGDTDSVVGGGGDRAGHVRAVAGAHRFVGWVIIVVNKIPARSQLADEVRMAWANARVDYRHSHRTILPGRHVPCLRQADRAVVPLVEREVGIAGHGCRPYRIVGIRPVHAGYVFKDRCSLLYGYVCLGCAQLGAGRGAVGGDRAVRSFGIRSADKEYPRKGKLVYYLVAGAS